MFFEIKKLNEASKIDSGNKFSEASFSLVVTHDDTSYPSASIHFRDQYLEGHKMKNREILISSHDMKHL